MCKYNNFTIFQNFVTKYQKTTQKRTLKLLKAYKHNVLVVIVNYLILIDLDV